MIALLEIRLPDELMERLPKERPALVEYLSRHFDEVIRQYEARFQRRVQGVMGGPLSRYERSLLKDFLLDMVLGHNRESLETGPFDKVMDPAKAVASE